MSDVHCCNCYYYQGGSELDLCCCYILLNGKKRPCPPGKDCTVKKPRKGGRRKVQNKGNGEKSAVFDVESAKYERWKHRRLL